MKILYRATCLAALFCISPAFGGEKPNVLLICVDDLKPALGCYGDKTAVTPAIDRFASRATLFERAYCNQAVCGPARNALITGLRPDTIGIYNNEINFRKAVPEAVTMPQAFKKAGYRTSGLGKILHVGGGNTDDKASWSIPSWTSNAEVYALKESTINPRKGDRGYRYAVDESADVPDETYADGQIAIEAIKRLEEAKSNPHQPFFMAVGFMKPHLPFVAPKNYWDLYDRAELPFAEFRKVPTGAPQYGPKFGGELTRYGGVPEVEAKKGRIPEDFQRRLIHGYYAATSYADAQVGKVLAALDELGLADNTIVVIWGDHGWHLGDHGMWCKHTNYEQAARLPLLISAPGAKPGSGRKTTAFAETVDIYPTLCEMAGLPAPAVTDGTSLAKVIADPAAVPKEHAIHVYPRKDRLGRAIRTATHRLVEWKIPGEAAETAVLELYDYRNDPLETRNIAEEDPATVARLRAVLSKYPEAKPLEPSADSP
jgi:iduronate 2-sulfatase